MAISVNTSKGRAKRSYSTLLVVVLAAVGIIGILAFFRPNSSNSLPSKYASVACNLISGTTLFDGKNAGEGMAVLQKNKTIAVTSDAYLGTNIYITLGDRQRATVLKALHNTKQTESISTEITVPSDYKSGAVPFHIYSTLLTGECGDLWQEVWIR